MFTVLLLMVSIFKNYIVDLLPDCLINNDRSDETSQVVYQNLPYCDIRRPVSNCSEPAYTKLPNGVAGVPSFNSLPDRNDMSIGDLTGVTAIINKYNNKEYSRKRQIYTDLLETKTQTSTPVTPYHHQPQTISLLSQDGGGSATEDSCIVLSGLRPENCEKYLSNNVENDRPDDPGGGVIFTNKYLNNQNSSVELTSRLKNIQVFDNESIPSNRLIHKVYGSNPKSETNLPSKKSSEEFICMSSENYRNRNELYDLNDNFNLHHAYPNVLTENSRPLSKESQRSDLYTPEQKYSDFSYDLEDKNKFITKENHFETPLSTQSRKNRHIQIYESSENLNDLGLDKNSKVSDNSIEFERKDIIQQSQECINPNIGVPPLNTARLVPTRHRTKNAILSLLDSGEVCLEFVKYKSKFKEDRVVDVYRISADGLRIIMYQPENGRGIPPQDEPPPLPNIGADAIFSYENLPQKHCKKYIYASRFIELVRAKTPKVTYYSDRAKCILMEKTTEFEACFYNGSKVVLSENEGIKMTYDGATIALPNVNKISELSYNFQAMWKHSEHCLKYCLQIEEILTDLNKTSNNTCFPVIIGRRPGNALTLKGKENITVTKCMTPQLMNTPPLMSTFNETQISGATVDGCSTAHTPTMTPRRVVIPNVGTALQFASGEVQIHYLDGSLLSLDSSNKNNIIKYKPSGQNYVLYGSGDPIPDTIRNKLTQVPTIIQHLINTPPMQPLKLRNHR